MNITACLVTAVALLGGGLASAQDQGQRPDDRNAQPRHEQPQGRAPARPAPDARPPAHRPPVSRPPANRPPFVGHRPPHRYLSGGAWRRSIRGPAFRYPPGFSYRIWATGAILPPVFLGPSYFFDGYSTLGLSPPPPGYRWVRYGPDLLLVNIISGRVADVVDGVFY